jgi:hypothetical protein
MSDEKSGCLGWFMALFGIKPHHIAGEEPAAKVQTDSSQMASAPQTEQPAPTLELLQQKPPPTAEIETFPYKETVVSVATEPCSIVSAVGSKRAVICPKVRLGDVFFVVDFKENLPHYFRIAEKHVDFLLCNPQTIKPIVGIELDDEGHQQRDRKERDKFIKKVFEAAGLPLVHIPVQPRYNAYGFSRNGCPTWAKRLSRQMP